MGTIQPGDYQDMDFSDLVLSAMDDPLAEAEMLRRAFPEVYAVEPGEAKDVACGAPGMGDHPVSRGIGTVMASEADQKKKRKKTRGLAYRRRPSSGD